MLLPSIPLVFAMRSSPMPRADGVARVSPIVSSCAARLAAGAGGPTPTPRGLLTSLSAGAHPVTESVTRS